MPPAAGPRGLSPPIVPPRSRPPSRASPPSPMRLEARREAVIAHAAAETGSHPMNCAPEFLGAWSRRFGSSRASSPRARGSGPRPIHPSAKRRAAIGPNHDVRSMFQPLGPVWSSARATSRFAYGVCGGDTASAAAAGCTVIVKEHPAHPGTGRLVCRDRPRRDPSSDHAKARVAARHRAAALARPSVQRERARPRAAQQRW